MSSKKKGGKSGKGTYNSSARNNPQKLIAAKTDDSVKLAKTTAPSDSISEEADEVLDTPVKEIAKTEKAAKAEKSENIVKKAETSADETEETVAKKEKKTKAAKTEEKKPNVFQKIGNYFRDLKVEFKKVKWAPKRQIFNHTTVVCCTVVAVGFGIFVVDTVFTKVFEFLTVTSA
jgi:preprotein translocase subunit SecE